MTVDSIIKLVCAIFLHAGFVIMAYSLYRLPIKASHRQITILSVVMGVVYYYIRYNLDSKMYFPATAAAFIVGLMIIRNYPFIFAFIVAGFSYFVGGIMDEVVTFGFMSALGITLDELVNNMAYLVIANVLATAIYLLVATLFVKQKWGFRFLIKRFGNSKWILKLHNFIWALSLILCMVVIQVTISSIDAFSFHWFFLVLLLVGFAGALYFTYRENQKVRKEMKRIIKDGANDIKIY